MPRPLAVASAYCREEIAVLYPGDCLRFLATIPDASVNLVITSPPYNIGKAYEKKAHLDEYIDWQATVIHECLRVLNPKGSICWQVGNYVDNGSIVPLDILLYPVFAKAGAVLRNRIIWHFEHGLNCRRRFSGVTRQLIVQGVRGQS